MVQRNLKILFIMYPTPTTIIWTLRDHYRYLISCFLLNIREKIELDNRDHGGHFLRWCRPYSWLFYWQNVWLGLRLSIQPSIDVTYGPGCRNGRGWVVKVVVVIFAFLDILLLFQIKSWALILSWLKKRRWDMGSRMNLPPHRVTEEPPWVSSWPKKAPNEPKMTKIITQIE